MQVEVYNLQLDVFTLNRAINSSCIIDIYYEEIAKDVFVIHGNITSNNNVIIFPEFLSSHKEASDMVDTLRRIIFGESLRELHPELFL